MTIVMRRSLLLTAGGRLPRDFIPCRDRLQPEPAGSIAGHENTLEVGRRAAKRAAWRG